MPIVYISIYINFTLKIALNKDKISTNYFLAYIKFNLELVGGWNNLSDVEKFK